MSTRKKEIRRAFRVAVFVRDNYRCRVCMLKGGNLGVKLDAHHITPREAMPNGGYVRSNGIALCPGCHRKAESWLTSSMPEGGSCYTPQALYERIRSSREQAEVDSEELA